MRYTVELPDDKPVFILAGRTVIYKKEAGKQLERKVVFCNFCGACCKDTECAQQWLKYERVHHEDGRVDEGWFCKRPGDEIPYTCVVGRGTPDECCIKFEKVP